MNFKKELIKLLSSNNFLIFIETEEEERLEYILVNLSNNIFKQKICTWNFIDGYINNPNYSKYGQRNPLEALDVISKQQNTDIKIFFLKDFCYFINDLSISRKLKNLFKWLKKYDKYIIISGLEKNIPNLLKEYLTCIKLPRPNKAEIELEVKRFIDISSIQEQNIIETLLNTYRGFTINKIRKSMSQIIASEKSTGDILKNVLNDKEQMIQQTEILEFYSTTKKILDIGGLKKLKAWLKIRYYAFTKQACIYGIKNPKGIILVGIQGTGKSLSAEAIATTWSLPLIKLDLSKVFTGVLGGSEAQIKVIITTCEQVSPCVLWIDEIDKIFTQNINSNDSGTTNRVTNLFLTWLSEEKKNVFIVATANSIKHLPIEMLRKGRFDEIFFVDLPNLQERINIFKIHLKRLRPITWKTYNIYYLSKISKKFSGAEIEQAIINAMYLSFYDKREFCTKDIIQSIKNIIPLAVTERNKIVRMRQWGHSGAVKIA
uniref:Uncharacterized AAA domain-containing protein ycf46 n=1 Tax=Digenea simplex TaxID=945030 RepID=A0A1Z1MTM2_DIGSM|nr:hypothetical protein [Digenea simplex]ARW69433.1 hypothetical protein [Digenea simplex]